MFNQSPNICYESGSLPVLITKTPTFISLHKIDNFLFHNNVLSNMKNIKIKIIFFFLFSTLTAATTYSQYNWKLDKDKDGIKVYESEIKNSNFKSIKVECVLQGTYDKLMAILNDVSRHKDWVYNSKGSNILKRNSPYEFYYYTETR